MRKRFRYKHGRDLLEPIVPEMNMHTHLARNEEVRRYHEAPPLGANSTKALMAMHRYGDVRRKM